MRFWWSMLLRALIIPCLMSAAGRMMWKHCPKRINRVIGYRTVRSMKNMDTWRFAHEHCGRLWWKTGSVMLLLSALVFLPLYHGEESTLERVGLVLAALQIIVLIASIFPTEMALKKNFDDDGARR